MADFVLVHGGCHGAWCWDPLKQALAGLGHKGHAFDLPGAGTDSSPRREVNVAGCVTAADAFIHNLGLGDFVLVGHSIAGILLPDIVLNHLDQVREVVFVAALVLDRGERGIDLIPESRRPAYYAMAEASTDGTLSVGYEEARKRFFPDLAEEQAREVYSRLTPQPFTVYLEPARTSASDLPVPRRYVVCARDATFPPAKARALGDKLGGEVAKIDSDHDVMLSHPRELARVLAESPHL